MTTPIITRRSADLNKKYDLRKHFNLSLEEFRAMETAQYGKCLICKEKPMKTLHVDHDHFLGYIRGLLCSPCNLTLGSFKENPRWMRNAIHYLTKPPITFIRPKITEVVDTENKICTACYIKKPLQDFHAMKGGKYGKRATCKACCVQAMKKRRATEAGRLHYNAYAVSYRTNGARAKQPPKPRVRKKDTKEQKRRWRMKSQFGLTMTELNAIYESQAFCCAICETPESELRKALHLDHNHDTNAIRGLLCVTCNLGLGTIQDNVTFFENAIRYLDLALLSPLTPISFLDEPSMPVFTVNVSS